MACGVVLQQSCHTFPAARMKYKYASAHRMKKTRKHTLLLNTTSAARVWEMCLSISATIRRPDVSLWWKSTVLKRNNVDFTLFTTLYCFLSSQKELPLVHQTGFLMAQKEPMLGMMNIQMDPCNREHTVLNGSQRKAGN